MAVGPRHQRALVGERDPLLLIGIALRFLSCLASISQSHVDGVEVGVGVGVFSGELVLRSGKF